jgi:hypothetical protein
MRVKVEKRKQKRVQHYLMAPRLSEQNQVLVRMQRAPLPERLVERSTVALYWI